MTSSGGLESLRGGPAQGGRRIALCVFEWFPHGGLQRDLVRVASALGERGHAVRVVTREWEGERPAGVEVREVPSRALTNVGRDLDFVRRVGGELGGVDCVVGFQRMPGLDVHYAADPCLAGRLAGRGALRRLSRRARVRLRWERAVFGRGSDTEVLVLSERERERIRSAYDTPAERLHLVPPTLGDEHVDERGAAAGRGELGLGAEELALLFVGSAFRTKGLDRAVRALAALPPELAARARLLVAGRAAPGRYARLARRLGVLERVRFLGGRDDVPALCSAADLLVHPAREENTGTVLIEALAARLPVVASGCCGYAELVARAGGGEVLPEPFAQEALDRALARLLADTGARRSAGAAGAAWARGADLRAGTALAVAVVERRAARGRGAGR